MKKKKTVYLAMSADLIHVGHLNIINIASKYGEVIVGFLGDAFSFFAGECNGEMGRMEAIVRLHSIFSLINAFDTFGKGCGHFI